MKNIVLAGFMGTGKTVVGECLARRLRRPFLDMDRELERQVGESVAQIFARRGERFFRERERELAREVSRCDGWVIAAGGGTFLRRENLLAFRDRGEIICLWAKPETLLRRLRGNDRPLLTPPAGSQTRRELVTDLLDRREASYRRLPLHVFTDGKRVEKVADEITELIDPWPVRVEVRAGPWKYPVEITPGLIERLVPRLAAWLEGSALIISDQNVMKLYGGPVHRALEEMGVIHDFAVIQPGEGSKTLLRAHDLYDRMISGGVDRGTAVIALGGGVVGDLAGYVASTFKRGLPLIHIPTTLVAQIDSSIGGKTGVNLPEAKNQVGTFYQPWGVLTDPLVLATLDERERRSGLAEAVKTALVGSAELWRLLEERVDDILSGEADTTTRLVELAAGVKARVVTRDPWERGERRVLNLGHTVGHALEKAGGYGKLTHGEAVGLGMVASVRVARRVGVASRGLEDRLVDLLERMDLPTRIEGLGRMAIWKTIAHDKKARGDGIWMILPRQPGKVEQMFFPLNELRELLRGL